MADSYTADDAGQVFRDGVMLAQVSLNQSPLERAAIAGRIASALAENERLREALRNLVSCNDQGSFEEIGQATDAARAALSEQEGK